MPIKFDGTIEGLTTSGLFSRSREVFAKVDPNSLEGTDAALYALAGGVLAIASHLIKIEGFEQIPDILRRLYQIELDEFQRRQRG
ncbi:hypothetical protein [Frankia tisae]|uniref:hypothetical protein n=1 Tax=Frankia tisae TaxID=2950104 RepID=UPI0021BE8074|nr:hypothetical protein [Frankia tisae]